MYKLSKLALTDQDIAKIKKRKNIPLWILGISVLIFDSIFLAVMHDDVMGILIAVGIFDLIMIIPMIIIVKRTQSDIDAGFKTCIRGQFDRKEILSTGKTTVPYLIFGVDKIVITFKEYKSVEQGDEVEIHFTFKSKSALSFKKL